MEFTNWTKHELADYLVDNGVYDNIEGALISDRCDLIDECLELGGDFMCNNCGGGFTRDEIKTDEWGDDYCTSCK